MVQGRISQIFNNTGTSKIINFYKQGKSLKSLIIQGPVKLTISQRFLRIDIRTKQRGTRDSLIYKLHALGWTQQEIADVVDISQVQVSEVLKVFQISEKSIKSDAKTKSVEEVATYHGLNLQTAWSVILHDKPDIEKFGELDIKLKVYDVWNYSECHNLLGQEHDGRIPGQHPES